MLGRVAKEINFLLSAINSGLNLLIVLLVGRYLPVSDYASFGAGLIYGGVLVVFIAFGNDTILARDYLKNQSSATVVVTTRALLMLAFGAIVLYLTSFPVMVGSVYLATTALQSRFYFEGRQAQGAYNVIGLFEKLSILGFLILFGGREGSQAVWIFVTLLVFRVGVSIAICAWIISVEGFPSGSSSWFETVRENFRNAVAFTIQFALMQIPAVYLVRTVSNDELAAFTATSQLGAGLLALVTQYQRPRIFLYLERNVSMRTEVSRSVLVVSLALLFLVSAASYVDRVFPLIDWKMLSIFAFQAVIFSILHPFELRRFAVASVSPWALYLSAAFAALTAVYLASQIGFSAVPVGALTCQILVFLFCRMWVSPVRRALE